MEFYAYKWKIDIKSNTVIVSCIDKDNHTCLLKLSGFKPNYCVKVSDYSGKMVTDEAIESSTIKVNGEDCFKFTGYPSDLIRVFSENKQNFINFNIPFEIQAITSLKTNYIGWITVEDSSLMEDSVVKVYTSSIDKVSKLDKQDTSVGYGLPREHNVMAIDVEVYNPKTNALPNPFIGDNAIMMITTHYKDETKVFSTVPLELDDHPEYLVKCSNEKDLIIKFFEYMRKDNNSPAFIIGYNIMSFDLHYLSARARYLKVHEYTADGNRYTREETDFNKKYKFVENRESGYIDLLFACKYYLKLDNYKFNTVIKHLFDKELDELNRDEVNHSFFICDVKQLTKLANRNIQGCQYFMSIFDKLAIFEKMFVDLSRKHTPIENLFNTNQKYLQDVETSYNLSTAINNAN